MTLTAPKGYEVLWSGKVSAARRRYGDTLVGGFVVTQPVGEWTGGLCKVTEMDSDPGAPEIPYGVKRLSDGEEIGLFKQEQVLVVVRKPRVRHFGDSK